MTTYTLDGGHCVQTVAAYECEEGLGGCDCTLTDVRSQETVDGSCCD